MYLPVLMRLLLSSDSLFGGIITKIVVNISFLHTAEVSHDLYIISSHESVYRGKYILTEYYGLLNSSTKCQVQSDKLFL